MNIALQMYEHSQMAQNMGVWQLKSARYILELIEEFRRGWV
jgi:hypothetical protein